MHPVDAPYNRRFFKESTTAYAPGIMRCLNDFFSGETGEIFVWKNRHFPYNPGAIFSLDK